MDLFDTETGLAKNLPSGELEQAFLDGRLSAPSGTMVPIFNPTDSSTIGVPIEEAYPLIESGMRFETPEEKAIREYRAEQKDGGILSSLKVFGKQAVNQALIGVPGAIAEGLDDGGPDLSQAEKFEIEKEESPSLNIAGGITGTLASILYGGPIWKAIGWGGEAAARTVQGAATVLGEKAAESIAARAAATVAKGAAEGALVAAPQALTETVLGDHETVGEGILAGLEIMGTGAVAGGVLQAGVSSLASPIAAAMKVAREQITPETLENLSARFQLKQFGFKTPELRKIERINQNRSPEEMAAFRAEFGEEAARSMSRTLTPGESYREGAKFAKEMGLGGMKNIAKGPEENLEKILEQKTLFEERLNTIRQTADKERPNAVSTDDVFPEMDKILETYNTTHGQATGSLNDAKLIKGIIQDAVSAKGGNLTLEEAHRVKQQIRDIAYPKGSANSQGAADAYRLWNDKIFSTLEGIANQSGGTLAADLKEANKILSKIYQYVGTAERPGPFRSAASRTASNNIIGPTDYGAGALGAILGDLPGATIAAGANYLKRNYSNQLLSSSLYGVAQVLDRVQSNSFITLDQALGISRRVKQSALPISASVMSRYFGEADTPQKKAERIGRIASDLGAFNSDAQKSAAILSAVTGDLSEEATMVQQVVMSKIGQATRYLAEQVPTAETPASPLNPHTFVPSDRQIAQFERKMQAVFEPMSVLKEIRNGTLTKEHVEALEAVYPKLLEALRARVRERLGMLKGPVPYQARQSMQLFLGDEFQSDMKGPAIQMLQENFKTDYKPKPRANSKITEASREQTDFSRIANN